MRSILLLVAASLFSGCALQKLPNPIDTMIERSQTVRVVDAPFAVDVPGAVSLDIETFQGDVKVMQRDDIRNARVTLIRSADHGWARKAEAEASLAQIECTVDTAQGDLGPILVIRNTTTHGEPHYQQASLLVEVPGLRNLGVRSTNGNVTIHGSEGWVNIELDRGNVILASDKVMDQPVNIVINNEGSMHYRTRKDSTGRFDCETLNGKVVQHIRGGKLRILQTNGTNIMRSVYNAGANPVVLRTARGDITISVVDRPEMYGAFLLN